MRVNPLDSALCGEDLAALQGLSPDAVVLPKAEQVEQARRIVAAFAASPGAGTLQIDGPMIDAPHLKQARMILDRSGETE